jgi:hypothetical protein
MPEAKATNPTWLVLWPLLKEPKPWVEVANTTYMIFPNTHTLLQAARQDMAVFADLLGTIEPAKLVRVLTAYTTGWTNGAFTNKVGGPLLQGQELSRFSEVSIVSEINF